MKKIKQYTDVVISISITEEQNKKLIKHSIKYEGNKSLVIRNLINNLK